MNNISLINEILSVVENKEVKKMKEVLVYAKYSMWLCFEQIVETSRNKYLKELLEKDVNCDDYLAEGIKFIENREKKDLLDLVKGKLYICDELISELDLEKNIGLKELLLEQTYLLLFSFSTSINNYGFYSVGIDIAKRDESPLYQIHYYASSTNCYFRQAVADHYKINNEYLNLLAKDPVVEVRLKVLDNPNLDNEIISMLKEDECELVRGKAISKYQTSKKKQIRH